MSNFKDDGEMIFSKLIFDTPEDGKKKTKVMTNKKASLLPSNPKQALEKIRMRKEKIDKLSTKEEKESSLKHDAWAKAFKRSQGIAVRDDVTKLRKAISKREKIKDKKKELWTERASKTKEEISKKAQKGQENIDSRKMLLKETRMTKRMGISKKSLYAKRSKEEKDKKMSKGHGGSNNKKMGSSGRHYKLGSNERREKKEKKDAPKRK